MNLGESIENLKVFSADFTIELAEDRDCCSTDDENTLKIHTENGGGGNYIILSTKRWAIDEDTVDAFCDFLKNVIKNVQVGE